MCPVYCRVHQFTKVEMFGVCEGDTAVSGALLDEFVAIQESIFTDLGLHFIVYDMPPHELGNSRRSYLQVVYGRLAFFLVRGVD